MKALSLTQPWASLVVLIGPDGKAEKGYETRSWRWTPRPQTVAVQAAKNFPKLARDLCAVEPFRSVLARHDFTHWSQLPTAAIVGQVRIGRTIQTENAIGRISDQEYAFGDYSNGRIAIELLEPVRLVEPIPCKGALGLWDVPAEIEQQIRAALSEVTR